MITPELARKQREERVARLRFEMWKFLRNEGTAPLGEVLAYLQLKSRDDGLISRAFADMFRRREIELDADRWVSLT